MPEKPPTAASYTNDFVAHVRATCLYVATKLGDLIDDLVVVGGLVPSLLVEQEPLIEGIEAHAGTMDLDVGLAKTLLSQGRYRTLTQRLRRSGFARDENDAGNPTNQRWKIQKTATVTLDFLIQPIQEGDRGGNLRHIEGDLAAIVAPGLHLAFEDRQRVTLSGRTILDEEATRDVWVCGPGAYVVLKALAFNLRGENKDAYDLFYLVRNYGAGVNDVAACLRPLLQDPAAQEALDILRRDFSTQNSVGPRRVAEFLTGRPNSAIHADVVGYLAALLRSLGE